MEYVYGYAADEYRSPLWLCAAIDGRNFLIHGNRGSRIDLLRAVSNNQIRILKGVHFFDAWRLSPSFTDVPELQVWPDWAHVKGLDGAEEEVKDAPDS